MFSNLQKLKEPTDEKEGKPLPSLIGVPEACDFLGVHRNTLYKLIESKEMPAFRLVKGGRWKFKREDLEQWVEDKQARANQ